MSTELIKQECPKCGRMVIALWTDKTRKGVFNTCMWCYDYEKNGKERPEAAKEKNHATTTI